MVKSDESGTAVCTDEPYEYDIHIYRYPDGHELVSEAQFTSAGEYTDYDIKFKSK